MWTAALAAAEASLASVKQSYTASIEDAHRSIDVHRRLADHANERIAQLEAQVEEGRALAASLHEQLSSLRAELSVSDERMQRLTAERQASDDARAQLQVLLAEGLEGLRKSSSKASDSFLGEINYLKLQLDAARSAERDLREQVQGSRQATSLELQILRQQNNGLLETNGRLNLHNQELTQQLAAALSRS
jgi:chromosome segregation ATPase